MISEIADSDGGYQFAGLIYLGSLISVYCTKDVP